jgi:nicotinic acid phosphoribosyltransferase
LAEIKNITDAVIEKGYSASNVAFGMGSGLLQKLNRDTMSFATKLCYIEYAGTFSRDIIFVYVL